MKGLKDILLLGDPRLYQTCDLVTIEDIPFLESWVADLDNAMKEIRATYHFGRAIAAPQLGIMKRLIYMNIDHPVVFINPELIFKSEDMIELWDDCMSFPRLLVYLKRHKHIRIKFVDMQWKEHTWDLRDDLSELLQHEYDHLNGILCTMRAIDTKSFKWR